MFILGDSFYSIGGFSVFLFVALRTAEKRGQTRGVDQGRLQAVFLFSWSVKQNARDTQIITRATEGAKQDRHTLVSRVLRLRRLTLAGSCTSLTKSEEKERLLAVYDP